ncbi:MAG: hypothetical protein CM1200mP36_05720 [Gammaproteobacteria bacterium]|nr:MAG: hypothetical protein CM1200mP36_05720 [Gammaproteobacteria bacterium]
MARDLAVGASPMHVLKTQSTGRSPAGIEARQRLGFCIPVNGERVPTNALPVGSFKPSAAFAAMAPSTALPPLFKGFDRDLGGQRMTCGRHAVFGPSPPNA